MEYRRISFVSIFSTLLMGIPAMAVAQDAIGVVTALKGKVKLTRGQTEINLRVKDGLLSRDVITTRDNSQVRILFGSKSTVTVSALSRLGITGTLGSAGTLRTIHELIEGEIMVNAPLGLSRRGDKIQIRTPNALASLRGGSLVTRCNSRPNSGTFGCEFTTLSGKVTIAPAGRDPITLSADASMDIKGRSASELHVGTMVKRSPDRMREMIRESELRAAVRNESNQQEIAEAQTNQAAQLSSAIVQALTGTPPTAESRELAAAIIAEPSEDFQPKDALEGSKQIKQLDNPASLITSPSEGGIVLLLPTP